MSVNANVSHGHRPQSAAPFMNKRNVPTVADFDIAAGGSNVCEVTISFQDGAGATVAEPLLFDVWLSDAATGAGKTGTTASGTVTAKSASGVVWTTEEAKKALKVQALATGLFVLEITDSAKTAFRVCVQNPVTGQVHVSDALVTANYG